LARTAKELAVRESSGGAAARKDCGGTAVRESYGCAQDGCGGVRGSCGAGEGTAALKNSTRRQLGFGFDGLKTATVVRLKRLRSAFHAMTGHGGRLTGRDGAASGQSLVSSWHDQTRPVRDDRTLTESDQSLPGNPTRMTGRGGGGRDRTRWSQRRVRCSVRSQILEKIFGMTGRAGGRRDRTR
jgi:hypothetical protein